MSILSSSEKQLAQKIIETGYVSAARSFSGIAQQQVSIKASDIIVSASSGEKFSIKETGAVTLLTTEIIGDIRGKSFLLFTEAEREAILAACLPPGGSADERIIMAEAILKELDNIVSAAVITEFSNALQVNIFGDVPQLIKGTAEEIQLSVLSALTDEAQEDVYLFADTCFVLEGDTTLQPQFFWKFHQDLVKLIQNHTDALRRY